MWMRIRSYIYNRRLIQMVAVLLNNLYIPGFFRAELFTGPSKAVCAPGLNCYSCPAAVVSCPVGALQALFASPAGAFPYYMAGFIGLAGMGGGRYTCGWLCPFGFLQELIYRLPSPKFSLYPALRYVKYAVLVIFVICLPLLAVNAAGTGTLGFCKYICPAGTLEAGWPFVVFYSRLWNYTGWLFVLKSGILIAVLAGTLFYYRLFCRVLCPLGAIYSMFNRFSFLRLQVDGEQCLSCGQCQDVCKMDIRVFEEPNSPECIRCYDCIRECPSQALKWVYRA